jgi:hypothetical protein
MIFNSYAMADMGEWAAIKRERGIEKLQGLRRVVY